MQVVLYGLVSGSLECPILEAYNMQGAFHLNGLSVVGIRLQEEGWKIGPRD